MPDIRPVSELRNNFSDISRLVHENNSPVFLTKNGYGDMVVMSVEAYEKLVSDNYINKKLLRQAVILSFQRIYIRISVLPDGYKFEV